MNTKIQLASAGVLLALNTPAWAENDIEKITVTAPRANSVVIESAAGSLTEPDAATWLEAIPGAGINRNGAITGIAQYRGLFGDRVSVKIDGHHIIGSGPNAMDTPLSYTAPILIDSMTAYRGIAPVYVGVDSLAGAIDVQMKQASFSPGLTAEIMASTHQQGEANNVAGIVNLGSKDHAVMLYGNSLEADNAEDANSRIIPSSFYDKQQFGFDYRTSKMGTSSGFSYHRTDTGVSGTAALPMDILYIKADRYDASGEFGIHDWTIDWALGHLNSKHGMDNHSHRANMMSSMFRLNTANAKSTDFMLTASDKTAFGELIIGVDGYISDHNSIITSDANPMFNIKNFYAVVDNRMGVFAHMDQQLSNSELALGIRVKQNHADAGDVSHHMAMMNSNIMQLQRNFNEANKSQTSTNIDLAANWQINWSKSSKLLLSAGVKQRAPSYQERYLWVPMQATGGLADGHTYIGDINLDSETAYQLNLGYSYQSATIQISPNVFYQQIDDYIQGVPSSNMAANMVGTMMSGAAPLQFANVDAKLYGFDMTAKWAVSKQWFINGTASYVRGERTDISDNLYRIAAPNIKLNANYAKGPWRAQLSWWLFAKQQNVSALNTESKCAGYGVIHTAVNYDFTNVNVEVGVKNLLDKAYASHIAGTNRVNMSQVVAGEKLPATGRDVYIRLHYWF